MLPLREWRATHLVRSWVGYWIVLLAAVAWRPLLDYWRISRSPSGHGSVNVTYAGGMLPLVLWIAGPPLLVFLLWLGTRSRATPDRETVRR